MTKTRRTVDTVEAAANLNNAALALKRWFYLLSTSLSSFLPLCFLHKSSQELATEVQWVHDGSEGKNVTHADT